MLVQADVLPVDATAREHELTKQANRLEDQVRARGVSVLCGVSKGVLVLYTISVFKGVLVLYSVFKGALEDFSVFIKK